jgi:hypothetical protein
METKVTDEKDSNKREEVELPRRFEVYAVELYKQRSLKDFADEFEYVLNDAQQRGVRVQQVQFIEKRGVIVIVDTETPLVMGGLVPVSPEMLQGILSRLKHGSSEGSEVLDPRLQSAIGGFIHGQQQSLATKGGDKEFAALKSHLASEFRGLDTQQMGELVQNLESFIVGHEKVCDSSEDCDVLRLTRLALKAIQESVRERLS